MCKKSVLYLSAAPLLLASCNLEDSDLWGVFGKTSLEVTPSIVVTEGASVVEIPYQVKGASKNSDDSKQGQMSFSWFTEDITAHRGVDYSVTSKALKLSDHQASNEDENIYGKEIIAQGISTGKISIPLLGNDDSLHEGDKHFKLIIKLPSLNNIEATDSVLESIITIKDNDPAPLISISDVTVSEGSQYAEIPYALNSRSGVKASFSWKTAPGSARKVDYRTIRSQNLSIAAGNTTGVLMVPLVNDNIDENTESFQVVIDARSLQGISLAGSTLQATVTIADDDEAPSIRAAQITRTGEKNRHARITYALSSASGKPVGFSWNTVEGSAKSGNDFTAVSAAPVTIGPGTKHFSILVEINDDQIDEGDESFEVIIAANSLTNITALGSNLRGEVIIVDDDQGPRISIIPGGNNISEGDAFAKSHLCLEHY